jgi:6-pyruvoyltetrahydropterin/6-carboxytetrahydropterin synthase
MEKYYSTKTYGTDRGLSCCFRQWRATHSHCSTLHGYSIGIKLIFESETLDDRNWVMDFGGLKVFKAWADDMFDHTLIIAKDDPHIDTFLALDDIGGGYDDRGVCDLRIVEGVGCEMFAKMCYDQMNKILLTLMLDDSNGRYPVKMSVRLKSVEVFEHAGNSAIYEIS